jgi:hypothetical protein
VQFADTTLDRHFALHAAIQLHYKLRHEPDHLAAAEAFCRKQVAISSDAASEFRTVFSSEGRDAARLPEHNGFQGLIDILEKRGDLTEAIILCESALEQGWQGDWRWRIERLKATLKPRTDAERYAATYSTSNYARYLKREMLYWKDIVDNFQADCTFSHPDGLKESDAEQLHQWMQMQINKLPNTEEIRNVLRLPVHNLGTEIEDYRILERIADGKPLLETQLDRHNYLLRAAPWYQSVHRAVATRQLASNAIRDMRRNGFDVNRAEEMWAEQTWLRDQKIAARESFLPESHRSARRLPPKAPRARSKPKSVLIRSPRDAELIAVEWMRYWGFTDAIATPVGADEGIDVTSERAIAQVKAHMVPIGRPEIQNLAGVASVERKLAMFFALNGYTAQAVQWADKAKVALFTFDLQGRPEAVNETARIHQP